MGRQTDQNGRTKMKQGRSTVDATYFDHVNVISCVSNSENCQILVC
jgi:hypothetical protein